MFVEFKKIDFPEVQVALRFLLAEKGAAGQITSRNTGVESLF